MKNSSTTLTLENRILGYSITAATILAGTVQAQISGTEVNATIDNTHPYTIRFNSNPRLILSKIGFASSGFGSIAYGVIKRTNSTGAGWKVAPMALGGGANVGTSGPWYTPSSDGNRAFIYVAKMTSGRIVTDMGGSFIGKGDKYIGVKFKIGGEQKYGWIKINVPDGASFLAGGYTIISFAYQQSGDPIDCDGVLPVELTSFTAAKLNSSVNLKWKTATEINNYGFDIERNTYPEFTDGKKEQTNNWGKIGFVEGSGNSSSEKSYSFTDPNPPSGLVLYRLKQIDADGNYKYYSQIAEVNNSLTDVEEKKLPTKYSLSQNYPNPFNPTTNIRFSLKESGNVKLEVYNTLGEKVKELVNRNMERGDHNVVFNGSDLPSGLYIYRLSTNNFVESKKMQIIK